MPSSMPSPAQKWCHVVDWIFLSKVCTILYRNVGIFKTYLNIVLVSVLGSPNKSYGKYSEFNTKSGHFGRNVPKNRMLLNPKLDGNSIVSNCVKNEYFFIPSNLRCCPALQVSSICFFTCQDAVASGRKTWFRIKRHGGAEYFFYLGEC